MVTAREEICVTPEAWTSSRRLLPPIFGLRLWYILRLDRLSQGSPGQRVLGGRSRLPREPTPVHLGGHPTGLLPSCRGGPSCPQLLPSIASASASTPHAMAIASP